MDYVVFSRTRGIFSCDLPRGVSWRTLVVELYPLPFNLLAIAAIVSGIVIATWWIIGLYGVHTRKQEDELPEIELPAHLHEVISGIPPVLIIFYLFIGLSLVLYVIYIWVWRISY
jgi:hypothetical protein